MSVITECTVSALSVGSSTHSLSIENASEEGMICVRIEEDVDSIATANEKRIVYATVSANDLIRAIAIVTGSKENSDPEVDPMVTH